jgi:hypothetical protein
MSTVRRLALAAGFGVAIPSAVISWHGHTATAAATFGSPVVVGSGASEPGIHVAPDGRTLYIEGPAGFLSNLPGSPSPLWRSDNDGTSWTQTPLGLRANLPGGGDSSLGIDPATGDLAFADLWLGSSTVSTSTDKGQTWLSQPIGGLVVQDRQWVAMTSGGNAYIAYHQIPTGIVVSKSPDGGLFYPISSVAATPVDQTGCVCPPGNAIAEGGGLLGLGDKVGVIFSTSTNGVKFARSTNGGLTFSVTTVANGSAATNVAFPVVANAGGGHLVATWLEDDGASTTRVGFASSGDWGATWGGQKYIVTGGASVYPWIAASGSHVVVTLYHSATTGVPDTVPASATWNESAVESLDGGQSFSGLTIVDPTPVKSGPICTAGTGCSANRDLGDFQSVAIDGAGKAVAAYNRVTSSGVLVIFDRES